MQCLHFRSTSRHIKMCSLAHCLRGVALASFSFTKEYRQVWKMMAMPAKFSEGKRNTHSDLRNIMQGVSGRAMTNLYMIDNNHRLLIFNETAMKNICTSISVNAEKIWGHYVYNFVQTHKGNYPCQL